MRARTVITLVLLAASAATPACMRTESALLDSLTGDPTQPDCGFALGTPGPDEPSIDPCGPEALLVRGPITLDPDPGNPATDSATFAIPEAGFACVHVTADDIAIARAALDGSPLLEESDFNATSDVLNRVAAVMPPEATIEWEVVATPRGTLTYEVRFAALDPTPRGLVTGSAGRLSLFNLSDALDPFSPADANGVRDTVTLAVTTEVDGAGISTTSATTHLVRVAFEIASAVSCTEVVRLESEVVITGATPITPSGNYRLVITAEWDGRDASGALVADGTYFYRAVADLIKVTPAGTEQVRDTATSEILTTSIDNQPPVIELRPIPEPREDPFVLGPDTADPFLLDMVIADTGGVAASALAYDSVGIPIPLSGRFFAPLPMPPVVGDDFVDHRLEVTATDLAGNTCERDETLRLLAAFNSRRLIVRFNANAAEREIDDILAELGGRVFHRDLTHRLFAVELVAPAVPIQDVALELSERSDVAYAVPDAPALSDVLTFPPGDPRFGDFCLGGRFFGPCSWHLDNPGFAAAGYATGASFACDADPMAPQPQCEFGQTCTQDACSFGDCCVCASDAECPANHSCIPSPPGTPPAPGVCALTGVADADIAWLDVPTELQAIADGLDAGGNPTAAVRIAVYEPEGIFLLNHEDLATSVFTNDLECCASPPCPDLDLDGLPDCTAGEVIPDADCTVTADCNVAAGQTCLLIPTHGRCDGGTFCTIGISCTTDDDCGFAGNCDLMTGTCVGGTFSAVGTPCASDTDCGFALPGCGFGNAPCLTLPAVGRCTDGCPGACGVDDDGDGFADDADPEVASLVANLLGNGIDDDEDCPGDTNGDGVPCLAGDLGVDEPDEAALAAWDDDENGVIDDMHGGDFLMAAWLGMLFATTQVDAFVRPSSHATGVASVAASGVDNAVGITGVHPRVELVAIGGGVNSLFPTAARYATSVDARIVNMSWGNEIGRASYPDDQAYFGAIASMEALFADGLDPNTVYVLSAGNDSRNLDAAPDPAGVGLWRFPTNISSEHTLVVTATNIKDEFAEFWSTSDATYSPWTILGPSFGATEVDLGAPGDGVGVAVLNNVYWAIVGTSFSAPGAAANEGLLISFFPGTFRHRPLLAIERVRATAEPLPTLAGITVSGGQLDLARAFDDVTFPLPALDLYEDDSFRLNDLQMMNTHDLDFVDADGDGSVDFLFEIFGGPFEDQEQPRMYRYDAVVNEFFDESTARLLSDVTGNYNKSEVGDVTGDGCTDIVLAGFFQLDPLLDPAVDPVPLMGLKNRLLVQDSVGITCLGTWTEDTSFPNRIDITRDVDLLDYDGDTDLDIFFTNSTFPRVGGNLGDQLLENTDGLGTFLDVSPAKLPIVAAPGHGDPHRAATSCDVNNDTFPDMILAVNALIPAHSNVLLINAPDPVNPGQRIFVDATPSSGFPGGSGFSHDVECFDFTGDMFVDLLFARRRGTKNLYFVNTGTESFIDTSSALPNVDDGTQEVEICDLDGDGIPEVLFGNGDIVQWTREANRVLRFDPATGTFSDDPTLGFDFGDPDDLTEDIDCGDLDNDGFVDAVLIGNTGMRNWLYLLQ